MTWHNLGNTWMCAYLLVFLVIVLSLLSQSSLARIARKSHQMEVHVGLIPSRECVGQVHVGKTRKLGWKTNKYFAEGQVKVHHEQDEFPKGTQENWKERWRNRTKDTQRFFGWQYCSQAWSQVCGAGVWKQWCDCTSFRGESSQETKHIYTTEKIHKITTISEVEAIFFGNEKGMFSNTDSEKNVRRSSQSIKFHNICEMRGNNRSDGVLKWQDLVTWNEFLWWKWVRRTNLARPHVKWICFRWRNDAVHAATFESYRRQRFRVRW